jgi:hypothetical protein
VSSQNYLFKVRAKNVYGYGDYSDTVTIRTSDVPDVMTPVTTISVMTTVVISWTEAADSGEPIDLYDIKIKQIDGTFVNDASCTGALDNGLTCLFSHAYLIATYNFEVGHIVQFIISAHNVNGWGVYSELNTGDAFIMTVPSKMQLVTENSATTFDQIKTDWQALTTFEQTGGTMSILSYSLEMYSTSTWESIVGGDSNYYTSLEWTETGLTTG